MELISRESAWTHSVTTYSMQLLDDIRPIREILITEMVREQRGIGEQFGSQKVQQTPELFHVLNKESVDQNATNQIHEFSENETSREIDILRFVKSV